MVAACELSIDSNTRLTAVSRDFLEGFGYSEAQLLGRKICVLIDWGQSDTAMDLLQASLLEGEGWSGLLWMVSFAGERCQVAVEVVPIVRGDACCTGYLVVIKRLVQRQPLVVTEGGFSESSLTTVTAGVAHYFNNILAALVGNSYLAKSQLHHAEEVEERLNNIDKLCADAAALVQHMLAFSSNRSVVMVRLQLDALIQSLCRVWRKKHAFYIDFHESIACSPVYITGSKHCIEELLFHLLDNACRATSKVKDPHIEVGLRVATKDLIASHAPELLNTTHDFVLLSVLDNGCGIPSGLSRTIFTPFFTTKATGEGTGMGLSVVYGIVQSHQGAVVVESREGCGSCFYIYLPILTD